jgi:hypothetical protein
MGRWRKFPPLEPLSCLRVHILIDASLDERNIKEREPRSNGISSKGWQALVGSLILAIAMKLCPRAGGFPKVLKRDVYPG